MKRFLRTPEKLKQHMTDKQIEFVDKQIEFVEKHIPVKYNWTWEFDQTKERLDYWLRKQPRGTVKDYYTTQSKYGGQIGIHHMRRGGRIINSLDDYKLFIAQESNRLTALGQFLFQQSVESFVYSVLGFQASTRCAIVGQGAERLQTRVVFRKIVQDTVVKDDQTITVNNMRKAIVDTHVILNTAITPGMILIPGSLIMLKQKIFGFNNILTMANYSMVFGKNGDVNRSIATESETKKAQKTIKERNVTNINFGFDGNSYLNNPSDKNFTTKTNTRSIPQVYTKRNSGTTKYLAKMYGISAVGGFVALKILSSVF